ncbi:hypothetical protein QAD02_020200 [Eretmocerus hayati]|uniref:Uncharacterized protein n=1 Tax=Eretmocerus hayati TaxID=131215 RepID=A0ACC2PMS9_9HYME|nr:hypothetical protein QAD02_020200 [Eretmocerus hayati]
MPQTSVQEKQVKVHVQSGRIQSHRRKRKATEPVEVSENVHPPKKLQTVSSDGTTPFGDVATPPTATFSPQMNISPLKEHQEPATWSDLRASTCFLTPSAHHSESGKAAPLPSLPWADGSQVWSLMCLGDQKSVTQRDPQMFQRHPTLQPRMRAILLDWLIEVCEVYKLHRETYYLAMDYIDRYLSNHQNVPKNQLQLIGITCLFIAAKVEEIYPPKIAEFAYVTDGACTEEEILGKELIVLKGLGWNLSPVTPPGWLNVFMQVDSGDWSRPNTFIYPQYGGLPYSQTSQLLDLATLDEGSLKFSYSHLAAAALYHTQGRECALRVSKLSWEQLAPCVKWLNAFSMTVSEERAQQMLRSAVPLVDSGSGSGLRVSVPNLVIDESHRIQTHVIDLEMLELAQQRLSDESLLNDCCVDLDAILESGSSPDQSGILTPPSSSRKNSPTPPRRTAQRQPYT